MEETAREREERLKGWSAFLDDGKQPQKNSEAQAAEGATTTTTTTTAVELTQMDSNTSSSQQGESQAEEQEVDSTDSSLAGSDEDAAWDCRCWTGLDGGVRTVRRFVIWVDERFDFCLVSVVSKPALARSFTLFLNS